MIIIRHSDLSISVQGHAGYADAGNDIVCAGVSTAVNYLMQTVQARKWTRAGVVVEGDFVLICLKPWICNVKEARRIVKDFVAVCANIAKEHPDNITVMEVVR